jgi:hypothetical protein
MNNIIALSSFIKGYKRFIKKFPNLKSELEQLQNELLLNPNLGEDLGHNLHKIRLASKDKNSGKSGGFRVITYLIVKTESQTSIYLLKIYDKSEEQTVKTNVLIKLVKSFFG